MSASCGSAAIKLKRCRLFHELAREAKSHGRAFRDADEALKQDREIVLEATEAEC